MSLSWPEFQADCKSPVPALARNWYVRAENRKERIRRQTEALRQAGARCRKLKASLREEQKKLRQALKENAELKQQLQTLQDAKPKPQVQLPEDRPVRHHQYGPRLMSLCVNLACQAGLRSAVRVLKLVGEWLEVKLAIPTWQTIRDWTRRHGLAMCRRARKAKGRTWIVDHSNQIGTDKLLVVLRTRSSHWKGKPLRHQDVEVIGLIPKDRWDTKEVGKIYCELAERYGEPRCILADGASELRDGAQELLKMGVKVLVRRDMKHYLANQMETLLGKNPRFQSFMKETGNTHAAIQQTELSHLTPQRAKAKARFMNLQPTLRGGAMALWQLDHPEAEGRQGISEERMEQKVGWLREYRKDLQQWQACHKIVELGIEFANTRGVFRGAAQEFKELVKPYAKDPLSRQLAKRTVTFLTEQEQGLRSGEHLPLSTEIVESCFGRYKQLEGQHAKSGFTTLLPAFGALLRKATPESITQSLQCVTNDDVRQWTKTNLGCTLAAKRQAAYREHRQATRTKRKKCATKDRRCT